MSLALYGKYRPSTFADVIGQEHVSTPLSNLNWAVKADLLELKSF